MDHTLNWMKTVIESAGRRKKGWGEGESVNTPDGDKEVRDGLALHRKT